MPANMRQSPVRIRVQILAGATQEDIPFRHAHTIPPLSAQNWRHGYQYSEGMKQPARLLSPLGAFDKRLVFGH